jgi:predicted component of type VI protein secretion system
MPGEINFEFRFGKGGSKRPAPGGGQIPFDIVVIADLAGPTAPNRPLGPLRAVDAETFDDVFAATAPKLRIEGVGDGGGALDLPLRSDGEFHPDRLLDALPALRALRSLGAAASDPTNFPKDEASSFERLLGGTPAGRTPSPEARGVDAFIRGVIAPHLVPGSDPRQQEVLRALELATADRLRAVLRQESVQRLEGTWAGVRRLAHRIETGGPVRLHLIDASPGTIVEDARHTGEDGVPPALHSLVERALTAHTLGGRGILLFDLAFRAAVADLALLARLAALARSVGLPLLAAADPSLAGARDAAQLDDPGSWGTAAGEAAPVWNALRGSELATWIALGLPRVVARPPYGARTEPVASIAFEEVADDPGPEGFVWMSSAFVLAEIVAAAVAEGDAEPLRAGGRAVDDLPFVAYSVPDGRKLRPALESSLPDRAVTRLLDAGLTPLVSDTSRAAVVLPRLQSIAEPAVPLGGAAS